ncbi:hypothetical protein L202_02482 [Cryptococcus amylolentus CBS 6039]|uniref:Uncharacterized protein n=1 Tax=Cryptococcus amylolentus CBS 6039 TaxID=1295533 RepID=A0A1E3I0R3_9TREE|nr:hypothetical protein L202_02482 [Cryptococcus amylolentus CBS 6039]ODN82192.1 hypothetical protein L202_02482 [Cryptococcus amylolentus CBS 6039]
MSPTIDRPEYFGLVSLFHSTQLKNGALTYSSTKLGQLLFTSQSSTLSSSLLRLIHSLLPEHIKGSGKASARAKCCKEVIVKQGWSLEVAKEGLVAIGRMEKDLEPRHLAKLINIFSKESSLVRPVAFTLTSMSIDGDDQAAEDDAIEAFDKGNMLLYIDSWGWRFELGGKLGSDVCFSYSHQDVRSANISTYDKESATHELIATSLLGDTTTIKFKSPSAALKSHIDLCAPRRISTPDPAETPSAAVKDLVKPYPKSVKSGKIIAPAKKVEEMKRKQLFSSMGGARGGTTITSDAEDVFSGVEDGPMPKGNRVAPVSSLSGGEKDAQGVRYKVEKQAEPKKEKVPVPFKSEEQEDSESEDEIFVNLRFISSTPKNAIAKTYGSKPSSRRPMLVKSPILDDPSPKSGAITATPDKRAPKVMKSTKKSFTLPTLTPGGEKESQQTRRLKAKSSTLAGEIKIGREATPGSLRDGSVESHTDKQVGRTPKAKSTVVSEKSKKAASSSVDTEHDDGDSSGENEKSPSIPTARPKTLQSAGTDEASPSAVKAGIVKSKKRKTKVAALEESESEAEAPLAKTRRSKSSVKPQIADSPTSETEAEAPSISPNPRRSKRSIPQDYPRADPDEGSSSDIGDVSPRTKRRIESSDEEVEAPPKKGKKIREEVVNEPTMEEGNKDESSTLKPKTKQRAKATLDKKPRPRASTTSKVDATVPSVADKTRRSSRRVSHTREPTLDLITASEEDEADGSASNDIQKKDTDISFEDLNAEEENHPATTIKAWASDAETARGVAPRRSIKSSAVTKRSFKSSPKRKRIPSLSLESSDSIPDSGFELDPIESSATSSDDGREEPSPKVAKVKIGSVKKSIAKNGRTKEVEKKTGAKENLKKDRSASVNTTGKAKKGGEKQDFSGSKMAKEFSAALKKNAGNTRARAR